MFVLRCTQKLLGRLQAAPDLTAPPSDTVLGAWYANLVRAGRVQVVLAVSERSLLPVVVPARDARTLVQRIVAAVDPMLQAVGVPAAEATAECCAMQTWALGKTENRRVIGSLNDLAYQLEGALPYWPERTLLDHALWLAGTPLKYIDYGSPDSATLAAFAAHRALQTARGR